MFDLDLAVLLAARLVAAYTAPIPDCDEVFNFWEPTHFMTHGHGLQTWEWSPVYAIRSWAYVVLHASALKLARLMGIEGPNLFFFLRSLFAVVEAYTESRLLKSVRRHAPDVANIYVVLSSAATGLFHASVAYLPSTFAMYCVTLATAYFYDDPTGSIVKTLTAIAVGGLLGWPFVLVLAVPLGLYFTASVSPQKFLKAVVSSALAVAAVLVAVVTIDSAYYDRLVVVPFNIFSYNVLSASSDAGPDIFGTEPWSYYVLNLVLNFNVMFPLALLGILFSDLQLSFVLSNLYLWLGIFLAQPHKEERFLFPVYPLIVLGASTTLSRVWSVATRIMTVPRQVAYFVVVAICAVSVARSMALSKYYYAPLSVYQDIPAGATVCVGREWYRFPSSYFMDGQLKFIASGFDGLLPGEFVNQTAIPPGMNSQNIKDPGKLVDLAVCDYAVDLAMPCDASVGETDFEQSDEWVRDVCAPFLDAAGSTGIARLLYLPVNVFGRAKWVDYCRYRRATEPAS